MAQSLSKEDFAKMQQQAINRVHEMQRQSKMNEEKTQPPPTYAAAPPKNETQPPVQEKRPPEQKRAAPQKRSAPSPAPEIKRVYTKSKPSTSALFEMDSDIALILPLLLLLQKDGADEMLILALLYIMS